MKFLPLATVLAILIIVCCLTVPAEGQRRCDKHCTSGCRKRGPGKCDRYCRPRVTWRLRKRDYTCQPRCGGHCMYCKSYLWCNACWIRGYRLKLRNGGRERICCRKSNPKCACDPYCLSGCKIAGQCDGLCMFGFILFGNRCFPDIVSRAQWGAFKPTMPAVPIKKPVSMVFIHHTDEYGVVGKGCFDHPACRQEVQNIQNKHMNNGLGMNDIAYNFLVGENGRVYAGRGWDVVGDHVRVGNCDEKSIGIAVIGNFNILLPPNAAAIRATKDLIDFGHWMGYLANDYTVHGHRDAANTLCPGWALHRLIGGWPRFGRPVIC